MHLHRCLVTPNFRFYFCLISLPDNHWGINSVLFPTEIKTNKASSMKTTHLLNNNIPFLTCSRLNLFYSFNAHMKVIRQGRRFQWQISSIWFLLFPHETAQYPFLILKQSNRNRTKWQLRFHSAGVNEKGKSWCCFCIFSRAVALLFNWKYFGGLKSYEISPGTMCGQHVDDMRSVKYHKSWQGMTYVICTSSAHCPEACTSSACHPHIIHASSRSMHIVHTSSTAPHKAHCLPCLSWSWIWKH